MNEDTRPQNTGSTTDQEQPSEVKNNLATPVQVESPYLRWLPYFILIVVIFATSTIIYFNNNRNDAISNNSKLEENNIGVEEKPPVETGLKSEVAEFSEPSASGIYKLTSTTGVEVELQPRELLQNGLYYKNRSSGETYHLIFEDSCSDQKIYKLKKLEGIESNKFFVYRKDGRYARDFENVYFDERQIYFSCASDYKLQILQGADPETFEPKIVTTFDVSQGNTFQGFYSRDSKTVFYGAEILDGADAETFRISENVSITSDNNHVYLWNEIIPNADSSTYTIIRDYSAAGRGTVYGTDKNNVFVDYCLLKGVDSGSFAIVRDEFMDKLGIFKIESLKGEVGKENSCSVIR